MRRALRWSSVLVYAAALTMLLVRPLPEVPLPLFPHADKLAHFVAFGLLGALLLRAMTAPRLAQPARWAFVSGLSISIVYAVLMEFVQGRVGREFSILDMVAGALGVVIVTWSWARLRTRLLLVR